MNRIRKTFEMLDGSGKKALIPYVTPEYPFKGMTVPLLHALEKAGADMIEVGIPFSDPLADGETIQRSSHVAIDNGATIETILKSVSEFRRGSQVPVILMGYVNPLFHLRFDNFLSASKAAGVDGVIVPDLPPEEASEFVAASERSGMSNVFLIAPTSDDARIREIDSLSTDFSYCVSLTGVTGSRAQLGASGDIDSFLARVRKNTTKPFVVGFGISRPEHVRHVWQFADGAVVGSSLINAMATAGTVDDALRSASHFLQSLRSSTESPSNE
jgi:tryptophan synthase alpha chain